MFVNGGTKSRHVFGLLFVITVYRTSKALSTLSPKKRRLSQKSATVAENGETTATVAEFGDSRQIVALFCDSVKELTTSVFLLTF